MHPTFILHLQLHEDIIAKNHAEHCCTGRTLCRQLRSWQLYWWSSHEQWCFGWLSSPLLFRQAGGISTRVQVSQQLEDLPSTWPQLDAAFWSTSQLHSTKHEQVLHKINKQMLLLLLLLLVPLLVIFLPIFHISGATSGQSGSLNDLSEDNLCKQWISTSPMPASKQWGSCIVFNYPHSQTAICHR